ncbi:MAG: linked oxidase domain protein [Fibrobacteria bacterium]|nr:linked oxidase domain protein [Fibrobacteria bacterium]
MTALSGWGRNPVVTASGIRPATLSAAASAVVAAPGFLPRGLGRSYGDASLPAPGTRFLGTEFLDRFIAFDPVEGVLEAEAGVSLHAILEAVVPRGFFLPVTPGTRWVTLAGAVASNVHGKNHHHAGSIERFVTALEVATPAGLFRCSPAERPDLFRATVGGYGLTGLITRVRLRLKPIASPRLRTLTLRARGLQELFATFRERDAGYEYSVAWIDTLATGKALGRGLLLLGRHAEAGDPAPGSPNEASPKVLFSVPFSAPAALLQPWALRLFNAAYYHLPRPAGERTAGLGGYFYPLDRIGNWNRMYGPAGFFQYQCVLPDQAGARAPAERGVEACLRFLAANGMGSFLAVLKRCGEDTVMLPFCRRGYTLALDVPNRGTETLRRLEELDRIVLDFGGRVYLTKDARLPRETFRKMYPEWKAWMETVTRYNPQGAGRSRMSERLGLWDA